MMKYFLLFYLFSLDFAESADLFSFAGDDAGFDDPAGGGIDPLTLMKFTGAATACNVDLLSTALTLGGAVSDTGTMDFGAISSIFDNMLAPLDKACSASEATTFREALSDFQQCSSVNLESLLETWPSASIGEMLNCASTTIQNVQSLFASGAFDDSNDLNGMSPFPVVGNQGFTPAAPSDRCVEAAFGPHPIGDFARQLWMHPDVFCGCLGELSSSIPDCTLDEWPIPLVGNWIRKSSCMINEAICPMMDDFCVTELDTLDRCLPPMDVTNGKKYDCDVVEKECQQDPSSLLNFPAEMTGAPMPDSCQKVSTTNVQFKDKNIVYRYNKHQNECVTKWEGWSDDYVSPGVTSTNMMRSGGTSKNQTQVVQQAWGGFIGGMLVSAAVFIGLGAIYYKKMQGNNFNHDGHGQFSMMDPNSIELS